ncbi:hypothetical protein [Streptomyces cucumeris]|uniref:hypothetical protein n=1 Tax=Streptomyces cucumeris TaxID=2962890 RepID=UPI0020C85B17|nr:hypothetical protein [Streptomyces sp. NEAU-Y11]
MTPRELFAAPQSIHPQWIHGSDIGVDEGGGLWVRADAELRSDLSVSASILGARVFPLNFREYSILTPGKMTGLDPRSRVEPVWHRINRLKADAMGSVGSAWIAVS